MWERYQFTRYWRGISPFTKGNQKVLKIKSVIGKLLRYSDKMKEKTIFKSRTRKYVLSNCQCYEKSAVFYDKLTTHHLWDILDIHKKGYKVIVSCQIMYKRTFILEFPKCSSKLHSIHRLAK